MSEQTITTILVAFFACLPPTIVALAALFSSWKNAKKSDILLEKTTEIHTATNGTLSALTKSLEVSAEKIGGLERLVASLAAKGNGGNPPAPPATKAG